MKFLSCAVFSLPNKPKFQRKTPESLDIPGFLHYNEVVVKIKKTMMETVVILKRQSEPGRVEARCE